jgi:hypothetical protein
MARIATLMKQALVAATAVAGSALSPTAQAADGSPVSGQAMIEVCRSLGNQVKSVDQFAQGTCAGIVTAVFQTAESMVVDGKRYVCLPKDVSYGQVMTLVIMFLDSHPELLNKNLSTLTAMALHDSYPCKD